MANKSGDDLVMRQLAQLFNSLAHDDAMKELIKMYPEDYERLVSKYRTEYVQDAANLSIKKR